MKKENKMNDTKIIDALLERLNEAKREALHVADFKTTVLLESIINFIEKRRNDEVYRE